MTTRTNPNQINPLDESRSTVPDGSYALEVVDGKVVGFVAESGGGGASFNDRRYFAQSGETSIDEFRDNSLDGAWTRVDGTGAASGNLTWTEAGDVLSVRSTGGDSGATIHGLVRALSGAGGSLSVGDGFVTAVSSLGPESNYSVFGLALTDGTTHGSGAQICATADYSAGNFLLRRFAGWNSQPANGGTSGLWARRSPVYLRLALVATDSWRMDVSNDGQGWAAIGSAISHSFTPTHVGFVDTSWGGSFIRNTSYEFIRRVSGVT